MYETLNRSELAVACMLRAKACLCERDEPMLWQWLAKEWEKLRVDLAEAKGEPTEAQRHRFRELVFAGKDLAAWPEALRQEYEAQKEAP